MPEAFVLFKTLPARERDVSDSSLTTVQSLSTRTYGEYDLLVRVSSEDAAIFQGC